MASPKPPSPPPPHPAGFSEEGTKPKTEEKPKEGGDPDPLKALSENPIVKTLMETVAAQGKKLDEQEVDKAAVSLSEKVAAKGRALPPAVAEAFKKQLSELPPANRPALIALMDSMVEAGQVGVELGERGGGGGQGTKTAFTTFSQAVQKKLSDGNGKVSYADAAMMVVSENPSMYVEYQRELAQSA